MPSDIERHIACLLWSSEVEFRSAGSATQMGRVSLANVLAVGMDAGIRHTISGSAMRDASHGQSRLSQGSI